MAPPPPTGDVEAQKYGFNDERYGISEERVQREGHPLHGVDPSSRLPIEYRTLSIHVDTEIPSEKGKAGEKRKAAVKGAYFMVNCNWEFFDSYFIEIADLDWHKISVDEALARQSVSPKAGLDKAQAQRRLQQNGKNVISPPKSNLWRKVIEWVFGGFGSLLLAASIVCFIAW
jgi:sodium/potassium-transporting ATPase subunit alpha